MNPAGAVDLSHTPGIYYALAYWLSCTLYIYMHPRKLSGRRLWSVQALFLLLIGGFMTVTDGVATVWFFPCVLFYVFLIFLYIKVCCGMPARKAGYFCARAFLLGEFAASLEWQLFYFGLTAAEIPLNLAVNLMFLCLSHGMVFAIVYVVERRFRDANAQLHISRKSLMGSVILCVAVFAFSNLSFVTDRTPFSSQLTEDIFLIRTLADLGGLIMLYNYHMQLQELHLKTEMKFLQNMLHMQYDNYRIAEESMALVDRKYHDLKHQIHLLRSEVTSEEKLAYLDQMEEDVKGYESRNKTGNRVLDAVLSTKSLQCQDQDINLTCVADGAALDFIHPMDLSALFGNALDNAIESVKKLTDPEKRLIHVSVAKQKNFLRIRVENCYAGELHYENGLPVTTKRDKRYHGFGIKSMQQIVEKYRGSMTIYTKGDWFELRILFPLEREKVEHENNGME